MQVDMVLYFLPKMFHNAMLRNVLRVLFAIADLRHHFSFGAGMHKTVIWLRAARDRSNPNIRPLQPGSDVMQVDPLYRSFENLKDKDI